MTVALQSKSVVIGTAGHIDHGKTALIRALTGVDTDRLPEEKRRGITVDLGFASLNAEAADGSPLRLSFIDVPGHALFVRNMLAGAGGIDAAMLVISAEEGVKPQTEEHLDICRMLGIRDGLTVISKTDAVSDARLSDVASAVRRFLDGSFLGAAPIVGVSAHTDTGMDTLHRELIALAMRVPARSSGSLMRLPLDRAFVMTGFGTVVTGTLIAGAVRTGETLVIEPGGRTARVRGIQVHGEAQEAVEAGNRVALNLVGIEAGELKRGDTLVELSKMGAEIGTIETIDVEIELLSHAAPLKHRGRVHFHAFSSECIATVSLYEYRPIEPRAARLARLKLSKPIVLLPGDRFVLRDSSAASTIGGGRVLDAHPLARQRKAQTQVWLQELQDATREGQALLRAARCGVAGISTSALAVEMGVQADALRALGAPLLKSGKLVGVSSDLVLTAEAFESAMAVVAREFEDRAKERRAAGLKRSELKSVTRLRSEVFDAVVKRLEDGGMLRVRNEFLAPPSSDGNESSSQSVRLAAVGTAFESAGLTAPLPDELAKGMAIDPAEMRRLVTLLLREKILVRLGSDSLCIHRSAIDSLKRKLQELRGQTIDVAGFKQLAGVSRKYAIPLLEHLDRERVTRKQGDVRIVL